MMNASAVKLFDFEHFVHKMDRELLPKVHRHGLRTPHNALISVELMALSKYMAKRDIKALWDTQA